MKKVFCAIAFLSLMLSCGERETQLFNGKDLAGWTFHVNPESEAPAADVFGVKNGVITIAGQPFGYMMTEGIYSDYTLHVEWRWVAEPSNSGIFLHAEPIDAIWPRCAEVNLKSGGAGGMISSGGSAFDELKESGGIFLNSPHESVENPAGEWNTAEITCKGNYIQACVNGTLMNEAHFDRTSGHIALQSEGGPLEIRNVYLKPLKD